MTTDSIAHEASVQQALDNLRLDYKNGDTGLQIESAIDSAGWVRLTSMRDGLQRPPIPQIHAARILAKRLPDGSPAFWMEGMPYTPPEPQIGTIKCYFHPDFDETDGAAGFGREFIDAAGLQGFTCNYGDPSKNNRGDFKSVMQRDSHMRSRHRRQLDAVEQAQAEQKDREQRAEQALERDYQRQQTEAMLKLLERQIAAAGPQIQVEPPETTLVTAERADYVPTSVTAMLVCEDCGFEAKGNVGLSAHRRGKIKAGDAQHA